MAKRKSLNNNAGSDDEGNASDGSSGSSAPSLIDVDFDFFAPSPDVDLIALKRLLRQLLYSDSDLFDLHPFAELLLEEGKAGGVGSTIKVDGEESDPFSFVGVVNLNLHQVRLTLCPTPPRMSFWYQADISFILALPSTTRSSFPSSTTFANSPPPRNPCIRFSPTCPHLGTLDRKSV